MNDWIKVTDAREVNDYSIYTTEGFYMVSGTHFTHSVDGVAINMEDEKIAFFSIHKLIYIEKKKSKNESTPTN